MPLSSGSKALIGVDDGQTRRNQYLFRDVNERIADISRGQSEDGSEFLCECGREDCNSVLNLSLTEYKDVRRQPEYFVVINGHCVENVDRIVMSGDGFDVVVQV